MSRLAGKVAVITGASRGSGAAMALAFAREGADLVLAARSRDELGDVAGAARGMGVQAEAVVTDIASPDSIEAMIARTLGRFGRLDVLINNAGGAGVYVEGGSAGLIDTTNAAWDGLFALNLRGPFVAAREAARIMRAQGGGAIINVGSVHGQFTRHSYQGYSAAKSALSELTAMWAVELGAYGIRVNEIAPGIIAAGRNAGRLLVSDDARQERERLIPLGRLGVPEDIASVVVFLASDESLYVSGAPIAVSGGWRGD